MSEAMQQHGAFSWCELMTTDVAAAKAFYTKLFGWDLAEFPMPDMEYTVISAGEKMIGGIMAMPAQANGMPPGWGCYVTVKDIEQTTKQVVELGGTVCIPINDIPNVGRMSVIQDPQGAFLTVMEYYTT